MCTTAGWEDNASHEMLLTWCWDLDHERRLVAINFSDAPVHGYIRLPRQWLPKGEDLNLTDPLKGETFLRSRSELEKSGLFVGLEKADFHFLTVEKG